MNSSKKWLLVSGGCIAFLFLIQLIPYGKNQTNPPTLAEPKWDSPRTRELFFNACKNCHSNQTIWPWYSRIAPASWLIQYDVDKGRSHLNVSEWGRLGHNHGDEAAQKIQEGEMPPWYFLPTHPEARLSKSEKVELISGLSMTFGGEKKE